MFVYGFASSVAMPRWGIGRHAPASACERTAVAVEPNPLGGDTVQIRQPARTTRVAARGAVGGGYRPRFAAVVGRHAPLRGRWRERGRRRKPENLWDHRFEGAHLLAGAGGGTPGDEGGRSGGFGGPQHRGDQRSQVEVALAGGAHDAGQHLLGCARQTGGGWPVKVRRKEGVTNHLHPESCAGRREAAGEALTAARMGRAIEHRKRACLERRTSVPHFQDHASDNWEPEGAGSDGVVNRSWSGRRSNMLSWSTCSIW